MNGSSVIFVGVKGTVVSIDKARGTELWRTRLTGSDFVNVVVEESKIYATTHGEVFCLSATTGEVLWHNPLKGLGFGLASIGLPAPQDAALAEAWRREKAAAAAAASTAVVTT